MFLLMFRFLQKNELFCFNFCSMNRCFLNNKNESFLKFFTFLTCFVKNWSMFFDENWFETTTKLIESMFEKVWFEKKSLTDLWTKNVSICWKKLFWKFEFTFVFDTFSSLNENDFSLFCFFWNARFIVLLLFITLFVVNACARFIVMLLLLFVNDDARIIVLMFWRF